MDQNMVTRFSIIIEQKILLKTKEGCPAHWIPQKWVGFYVTGPFGTLSSVKFNKLSILQTQGHFLLQFLFVVLELKFAWNIYLDEHMTEKLIVCVKIEYV